MRRNAKSFLFIFAALLSTEVVSGAIINVPANGNLQAALNAARPGDTIALAPGAVYGTVVLPPNAGPQVITITTSQTQPPLTVPGMRITPTQAAMFAKIVAPSWLSAITVSAYATHYVLRTLEITVVPGGYAVDLINLLSPARSDINTYSSGITIDQCYIHGDPNTGGKRGVAMNNAGATIKNSYFSDFKSDFQDTQAIADWTGPGPFQIINNYLEGGQGILFGGAAPYIQGLVPSNIVISNNYFSRPMAWKGVWPIKNNLEFKNAQNVTVYGNIFENNWESAQNGFSILFTVRTCEAGDYPWAVVKNVDFTYNLIRHVDQGINVMGTDDVRVNCPPPAIAGLTSNILIQNNLFEHVGQPQNWGACLQILSGAQDITFNHNTCMQTGYIMDFDGRPSQNIVLANNLTPHGNGGVLGNSTVGQIQTFARYVSSGGEYEGNILVGRAQPGYASGNYWPATMDDVGFVDYSNDNYQLAPNSAYKGMGTDGKDIGADYMGVIAATKFVVLGNSPVPPSCAALGVCR